MFSFLEENATLILIVFCAVIALELLVKVLISLRKNAVSGRRRDRLSMDVSAEIGANTPAVCILLRAKTHTPVFVTPNAEEITGIGADSLYSDAGILQTIFSREDDRRMKNDLRDWDGETSYQTEITYTKRGCEEPRCGYFFLNRTKDKKYIIIIFEDRTDVWQREQQLQRQLAEAQMVDESKTIFLSKMSHEIRTPMNGMLGMISLAKISASAGNNSEAEDYLGRAESLSQFLLSIINDILDMTRIESGKLELESAPFAISGMLDKIRAMFETTITEKGIRFAVETDDFSNTTVLGDEAASDAGDYQSAFQRI